MQRFLDSYDAKEGNIDELMTGLRSQEFNSKKFLRFLGRDLISEVGMSEFVNRVNEREDLVPKIFKTEAKFFCEGLEDSIHRAMDYNSPLSMEVNIIQGNQYLVDIRDNQEHPKQPRKCRPA